MNIFQNYSITNDIRAEIASGLKCEKIIFKNPSFNNLKAFQFSKLNKTGRMVFGLGVDSKEKSAVIKGFVELYERISFFEQGLANGFDSTNGIAGHRFIFLARQAAFAEVMERDSFLIHWYSKTPFKVMQLDDSWNTYRLALQADGYEIVICKTTLSPMKTTICFLIDSKTSGFVIGLSTGKSESENREKAFSEALVNLYLGGYGKTINEQLSDLESNGLNSLANHRAYWLYKNTLPAWVFNSSQTEQFLKTNNYPTKSKVVFTTKYKNICVAGVKVENALKLEVGFPSLGQTSLVESRLKINTDKTLPDAHPIP